MRRPFKKGAGRRSARPAAVIATAIASAACLDRPLAAVPAEIKTDVTIAVDQTGVDKVDILFDIDNSASMGDKQTYLIEAIPQMIARLVTPDCVDANGQPIPGQVASTTTGLCAAGTPEFRAVHDMHIGVVTSSLGDRGGDECATGTIETTSGITVDAHRDDQGHLIDRTSTATEPFGAGPTIPEAALPAGGGFLSWFPTNDLANAGKTPVTPPVALGTIGTAGASGTLVGDFTEVIQGSGESGCGIESQLESWYRFLIQPDPYASITVNAAGVAEWTGVDTTILQQRHDFLRPDSLVAVIVLTDENDSEIDVRAFQGSGYRFLSSSYAPSRATSACAVDPLSPACVTCPDTCPAGSDAGPCADPNCQASTTFDKETYANDWGYDPNLRHVHMAQKYGPSALSAQFPLTRYFNGLTSATVPNRVGEYPLATDGYVGQNNCTNPLFAKVLPQASDVPDALSDSPAEIGTTLCNLPGGSPRTAADVFFAHIGGVPHQLLQARPGDNSGQCPPAGSVSGPPPAGTTCGATQYYDLTSGACADCPQKDLLASSDWQKILGSGTAAYASAVNLGEPATVSFDYSGIDPHMIESQAPRNIVVSGTPMSSPPVATLSGPGFGAGPDPLRPDPISGREWTTNQGPSHSLAVDREYACIFPLPIALQRDCATYGYSTVEGNSCDCVPGGAWTSGGKPGPTGNTADEVPPLCSMTSTDPAQSIKSAVGDYTVQTYAKAYPTIRELTLAAMMGDQGIVSSLCPIHVADNEAGNDPLYGYRPAVNAIVDRLKGVLGSECVPELSPDSTGDVACLVLVSFSPTSGGPSSDTDCASYPGGGYSNADPTVLAQLHAQQSATDAGGVDLASEVTCALNQVPVHENNTCAGGTTPGWCYVFGNGVPATSRCSQQISYSDPSIIPNGATVRLHCIATSGGAVADGGTDGG